MGGGRACEVLPLRKGVCVCGGGGGGTSFEVVLTWEL